MKKSKLIILLLLSSSLIFSQENVGIGTSTPDSSAALEIESTNKGLLIPRMDSIARNSIVNPANSLLIFNTDIQCFEGFSTAKNKWFSFGCLKEPPFICGEELVDARDGNAYKTVQIGNQCWMAENLKYLPDVVHNNIDFRAQGNTTNKLPGYGVYGYNGSDVDEAKDYVYDTVSVYTTYGVLYNWYAVVNGTISSDANPSGIQGACPEGWHVPSDAEWCEMEQVVESTIDCSSTGYRGDAQGVGNQLKVPSWLGSAGNLGGDGTDNYGFAGLPGGYRNATGTFFNISKYGRWWTTSESSTTAYHRYLYDEEAGINRGANSKSLGYSLRCVQD